MRRRELNNIFKRVVAILACLSLLACTPTAVDASAAQDGAQGSAKQAGDESKVEYFLVNSPYLESPGEQKFVLSFGDGSEQIEDMTMYFAKDGETEQALACDSRSGKIFCFTKSFTEADRGVYTVSGVTYRMDGQDYSLSFADLGMDVRFGVDETYEGYEDLVSLEDLDEESDTTDSEESAQASTGEIAKVDSEDLPEIQTKVEAAVADASTDTASVDTQSSSEDGTSSASDSEAEKGTDSNPLVVCIDAGHGGRDSGAVYGSAHESVLALKIAQACRDELESRYKNVRVVMTRDSDIYIPLEERVEIAYANRANLFVCLHLNASGGRGAEVYYPNTNYRPDLSEEAKELASSIENELTSLRIMRRGDGILIRNTENGSTYPDGSPSDYLSVIRNAKKRGIPAVLVEHCFIDNSSDYNAFLSSDAKLKKLGVADATGIARAYNLQSKGANDAAEERARIDALATENKDVIADGEYALHSDLDGGYVLDLAGASNADGANIQLYQSNGTDAQTWIVSHDSTGYITLQSKASGKVADIESGTMRAGTNIRQYTSNGTYAQKWIAVDDGNGSVSFLSAANTDYALSVNATSAKNSANVWLYGSYSEDNQKWTLSADSSDSSDEDTSSGSDSGSDQTALEDGVYEIESAVNTGYVLDVTGGSRSDGANIQLYQANNSGAQKWVVSHDSSGYIILKNLQSGKVLDIPGGQAYSGNNLQQYTPNGTKAQKWIASKNSDGSYTLKSAINSGIVIDLAGAVARNGQNVRVYSARGTKAQRWCFTKLQDQTDTSSDSDAGDSENTDSSDTAGTDAVADGTYEILSAVNSGYSLDVTGASKKNGANIQLYQVNHSGAQTWILSHDSEGYVTLKSQASGKVLDIPGGLAKNGSNVQQYASNGTKAQKWIAEKNSDGSVTFRSALNRNLVLDLSGGLAKNNQNVQIYSSNNTKAQRWILKEK